MGGGWSNQGGFGYGNIVYGGYGYPIGGYNYPTGVYATTVVPNYVPVETVITTPVVSAAPSTKTSKN